MAHSEFRDLFGGYLEAALWSSVGDGGEPMDSMGLELAPGETFRLAIRLARMARKHHRLMARAIELHSDSARGDRWSGPELLGHDLWLSQVGHGTGAWDRECLNICTFCSDIEGAYIVGHACSNCGAEFTIGYAITQLAKTLGEGVHPYIGDCGGLYFD